MREGWPKRENILSNKLRECAPDLRAVGIDVQFCDNERPKRVVFRDRLAPLDPKTSLYGDTENDATSACAVIRHGAGNV
jgi:hypothetical protein